MSGNDLVCSATRHRCCCSCPPPHLVPPAHWVGRSGGGGGGGRNRSDHCRAGSIASIAGSVGKAMSDTEIVCGGARLKRPLLASPQVSTTCASTCTPAQCLVPLHAHCAMRGTYYGCDAVRRRYGRRCGRRCICGRGDFSPTLLSALCAMSGAQPVTRVSGRGRSGGRGDRRRCSG
eukprot:1257934-Rhodomonas_salina.10